MQYEARWSRSIHLGLAAATLSLSVLGLAAAGVIPTGSEPQPAIGWAIVAACAAGAGVFVMRAFNASPQVRADARGIWTRKLGDDPVAWGDISGIATFRSGIQRIVRVERAGAGRSFGINTTFYDQGMNPLLQVVRRYRPDLYA